MKIFKFFIVVVVIATTLYSFFIILENGDFIRKLTEKQPFSIIREDSDRYLITVKGVIRETNRERESQGLISLTENRYLNIAAEMKIDDMFNNQYFAHVSPLGKEAGDLVLKTGYVFIAVGENLASGNFEGDKVLVNGWMESPGHRENILNPGYLEIGVAVKRGTFEERDIWMAVQIFALPEEACPGPDRNILFEITEREEMLSIIISQIETLKTEIESFFPRNNEKIREYNALVRQYNLISEEIRVLVRKYNSQIESSNNCIASYGF